MKLRLKVAIRLVIILTLYVSFTGCDPQPTVQSIEYSLEWSNDSPFSVHMTVRVPTHPTQAITFIRFPERLDRHRGWIEFHALPDASLDETEWTPVLDEEGATAYSFSFISNMDSSQTDFSSSMANRHFALLHPMDLFCIPTGLKSDSKVTVSFIVPDGFTFFCAGNPLPQDPNTQQFDGADVFNQFVGIGEFRSSSSNVNGHTMNLLVPDTLSARMENELGLSLLESARAISRHFPKEPTTIRMAAVVTQEKISRAMRRGNIIILSISDVLGIDTEVHKKIAHELGHIFSDTSHNASWFEESVSEYMAWVTLARTGRILRSEFFDVLSQKLMQASFKPFKGSLNDAVSGDSWSEGYGYVYSFGMISMFTLDADIRTRHSDKNLEGFLRVMTENAPGTWDDDREIIRLMASYADKDAAEFLRQISTGNIDVKHRFSAAGLTISEAGFTLLDIPQKRTGRLGRILPSDTIIRLNRTAMTTSELKNYLKKHVGDTVTLEIERDKNRFEQEHLIIPRFRVEPAVFTTSAPYSKILSEN